MLSKIIKNNNEIILQSKRSYLVVFIYNIKSANKCAYLSLLGVRADFQNQDFGKFTLSKIGNYVADNWNVNYIEMTFISLKAELIA
jgi:hypothetical protein